MTIRLEGIAAVSFDAVGTLFHLRAPVGEIYLERARRYGLDSSDPDLPRKLTDSFRRALAAQRPLAFANEPADRIPTLERQWWKSVVTTTFSSFERPRSFDAFFDDVYEMFRTADGWRLDPDSRSVLRALRDGGLKIGLVTNYDSRVLDVLESLGMRRLFDQVAVSSLVGAAKPDPRIFHAACAALSCAPAEAVHVGDDYEEDLQGAKQAGVHGLLYDPRGRYEGRNLPRICELVDLLEILV
ncbi:MAG: HAD-IA family hydrolase [Acidobacteriota bacterium]